MKKGQTEIIGLVFVVLIISVGIIFYLKMNSGQEDGDLKQDFTDTKLASNTLSVLLRTTDQDLEVEVRNLWQACAENRRIAGVEPCGKARSLSQDILDSTLKEFERDYFFNVSDSLLSIGEPCPFEKQTESFFLPSDQGPIELSLEICR